MLLTACAHRGVRLGRGPANLPAPALVTPRDQAIFRNHPREVRFAWSRVPQAASYTIEIDCLGCCAPGRWCSEVQGRDQVVPNLTAITYSFEFWGDRQGRWRVWAVNGRGRPGAKSAWSGFAFQAAAREDTGKPSPFGAPARRR